MGHIHWTWCSYFDLWDFCSFLSELHLIFHSWIGNRICILLRILVVIYLEDLTLLVLNCESSLKLCLFGFVFYGQQQLEFICCFKWLCKISKYSIWWTKGKFYILFYHSCYSPQTGPITRMDCENSLFESLILFGQYNFGMNWKIIWGKTDANLQKRTNKSPNLNFTLSIFSSKLLANFIVLWTSSLSKKFALLLEILKFHS